MPLENKQLKSKEERMGGGGGLLRQNTRGTPSTLCKGGEEQKEKSKKQRCRTNAIESLTLYSLSGRSSELSEALHPQSWDLYVLQAWYALDSSSLNKVVALDHTSRPLGNGSARVLACCRANTTGLHWLDHVEAAWDIGAEPCMCRRWETWRSETKVTLWAIRQL
jgi:hypothetical protein